MFTLTALVTAVTVITIFNVLAPYIRLMVRHLPRMLFDDLTPAQRDGIIAQFQALGR